MTPEQKFRTTVRSHLDALSEQLVPVLKRLIAHRYPKEVFALCFEIFPDSFTSQFPIRAFFMDRENCEHFEYVDGIAEYPSPVDPELLAIDAVYPEDLEVAFEEDGGLDLWRLASEEAAVWLYDCWKKAGGSSFALEATVADHNSSVELNLKSGKWQAKYALFTS
ncbi:MAG: hypothetical protein CVU22_13650 [Betaproteobacteria bacterium HGW-Betaproteobacteria-16]|nr:MAG: hypothetical protein CVU22_13650 [Betaproteobacteria bacterium HGW-Betaproteobacteria-16]